MSQILAGTVKITFHNNVQLSHEPAEILAAKSHHLVVKDLQTF